MLVDTKLRDNISDMIAYEKHTAAGGQDGQDGKQQKLRDHFEELRERQRLAQREGDFAPAKPGDTLASIKQATS